METPSILQLTIQLNYLAFYSFLQQRVLSSLFISKTMYNDLLLKKNLNLIPCKQLNIVFQTTRIYDINLLTINALCLLLLGQYPGVRFNKQLAKYKRSKIRFTISFSRKKMCYSLFKLIHLTSARQYEFTGYIYKNIYSITPQTQILLPIKTLQLFYMIDFLYGQQEKSILTVHQKITLNIECLFFLTKDNSSIDFLSSMNVPFYLENLENSLTNEVITNAV